jgi:pimeloyl-ACP methyl ester carboxylesterase
MAKNAKKTPQSLKIPLIIVVTGRFLSLFSSKLTTLFAAKIFTTPIKHKIPKRELEMDAKSCQELVFVPAIKKEIMVYHYGDSKNKVLLVHGWSGRGTQMFKIADYLLKNDFSTISFDAPGHGKSPGNSTIMIEFIETILFLEQKFGKFHAAVGHSLGAISLLNATCSGLKINKLVTIGSANLIKDIIDDFVKKIELKLTYSHLLQAYFENKFKRSMDSFSAQLAAKEVDIPVLVIHDENDIEVPVKCAIQIHKQLKNGQLMLTHDLGHTKILGDNNVIEQIVAFLNLSTAENNILT